MDFEIIFAGDIIVSFVYYSTNLAPLSFPYYEIRGMYSRKKNNDPNIYIYIVIFPSRYALYAVAQTNEYFIG